MQADLARDSPVLLDARGAAAAAQDPRAALQAVLKPREVVVRHQAGGLHPYGAAEDRIPRTPRPPAQVL